MNLVINSVRLPFAFLVLLLLILINPVLAQEDPLPFGMVTAAELKMDYYPQDTSASAVVLKEQGLAYVDPSYERNLKLIYHVKIKILKKQGLEQANVSVPLYKGAKSDILQNVKGSTFNMVNGSMKETPFDNKGIYTENIGKYYDLKKFTLPDVRVGSVIEYTYELEQPYYSQNFQPWEFQSDIPKIESEYWAIIPANFRYNISLRGTLPLFSNESEALPGYFRLDNGMRADCMRHKWIMRHVPAFIEEDYMTARKNFISAIRFELAEYNRFDGRKEKITTEWKDAETELRYEEKFGKQLKRGEDVLGDKIKQVIETELDPLVKAKAVFQFIRRHYSWNEYYGMHSMDGIRKAFEKKLGNVGDINLSLVAALRYAGLSADPLILSTRENGLTTDLYPVLSEFNYVVCKFNVGEKVYLLDATEDYLPFGNLPYRCLNGRGRVIPEKEPSYWYDIKPADRRKQISIYNLKLDKDGMLSGTSQVSYIGYRSASKRAEILKHPNAEEYKKAAINKATHIEVTDIALKNLEDSSKPLVEIQTIRHELFDETSSHFLFNPILDSEWPENPFKSMERTYPVDFGVAIDESMIINIELPEGVGIEEIPAKVAISLPNNAGRFIMEFQTSDNKLTISNTMVISRPIFMPDEYPALKEFFNQVVKTINTEILFRRKV